MNNYSSKPCPGTKLVRDISSNFSQSVTKQGKRVTVRRGITSKPFSVAKTETGHRRRLSGIGINTVKEMTMKFEGRSDRMDLPVPKSEFEEETGEYSSEKKRIIMAAAALLRLYELSAPHS